MPEKAEPKLITMAQLAALAGCSERTIERRIRDSDLPAYRIGVLVRLDRDEALRHIKSGGCAK